jgi:hypothetical protein
MARIVLSLAEWQSIARELAGAHTVPAPPGLQQRVKALLEQAPQTWPDQSFGLELDESSAEAVRTIYASMDSHPPDTAERDACVAQAMRIIHDHQQR